MRKKWIKLILVFTLIMTGVAAFKSDVKAASPHAVESSVSNAWNSGNVKLGSKSNSWTGGTRLVYDVYSSKYQSNGWEIQSRNFTGTTKKYLKFSGWAVLAGYKRHTSSNQSTHIVLKKTSGSSGVGTTKIYNTIPISIDATEDLEYNNQGSGVWNECSASARNKNNTTCNMRYDDVGFTAYIPLDEIFASQKEDAEWKLYIVKRVDNQIVYSSLIVPFEFSALSYNSGKVDLSSGTNTRLLRMNDYPVIRRNYPRQPASSAPNVYFTNGNYYTSIDMEESKTAVWYGVNYGGTKKWANTVYWTFGGSQAVLSYTPPPDTQPPIHISHELINERYKNGNDFWVQPNDQVYIRLRQRDPDSGNLFQYLRLDGSGQDVRSQHDFMGSSSNHNDFQTSSNLDINSAAREENTSYGKVKWGVVPKIHGDSFNVLYYYRDKDNNSVGYDDTGMNLRVDGVAPQLTSSGVYNYRYKNGSDYWVRPNDQINVKIRQYDPHSGNNTQYLRLLGSGQDVRSSHIFSYWEGYNDQFMTSTHAAIDSANREEHSGAYSKVDWGITAKTHGDSYAIQYYTKDNVSNVDGYNNIGANLRVDGVAPTVQFRNSADTADYTGRDWAFSPVDVRLKFNDSDSGYKRSRYSWSTSSSTPSSWSSWSTSSNYSVSKASKGEWYLHIQAEDHVGNVVTTYKGPYKYHQINLTAQSIELLDLNNQPMSSLIKGNKYIAKIVYQNTGDTIADAHKVNLTDNGQYLNYVSEGKLWPGDTRTSYIEFTANSSGSSRTFTSNVDAGNLVEETNENDNDVSKTIKVNDPNLKGLSTRVLTPTGYDINEFVYGDTVRVVGYIHSDAPLGTVNHTHVLNGKTQGNITAIDYPSAMNRSVVKEYKNLAPGDYSVKAFADYDNRIIESNEGDNYSSTAYFTVKDRNLTADSIEILDINDKPVDHLTIGEKYHARFTYTNTGEVTVGNHINKMFENNTYRAGGTTSSSLDAGKTRVQTWEFTPKSKGNVTFKGHVNETKQVIESNYNDNTVSTSIYVNEKPEITLTYNPSDVFEGDKVEVCAIPTDADGDPLEVTIEMNEKSSGFVEVLNKTNLSSGQKVCYYLNQSEVGDYEFKATVDDGYDSSDVTISFYSKPLTIIGQVLHTPDWLKLHQSKGNRIDEFYSGEKFVLVANTTNYPISNLSVTMNAVQKKGTIYKPKIPIPYTSGTRHQTEYEDPMLMETGTALKNGPAEFHFEVEYTNGTVKTDDVTIQIIGDVFEYFKMHRIY
ncbi:CARDB domain-containing protein [Rossellomorea arthrocnemi]|uniref:CARDB domain-containing protein n=1 Tax=Rossellomorea arthrocnemi TaxID=2769542 RepID=UPI00191A9D64|nr:CARDB domain-containing protein [Rossellomorea arthrocnemi]